MVLNNKGSINIYIPQGAVRFNGTSSAISITDRSYSTQIRGNFSIGIELQNGGYLAGYALTGEWPKFPDAQIDALKELLVQLMAKHPIPLNRIIGHEDIAPGRKTDPGPAFPWKKIRG